MFFCEVDGSRGRGKEMELNMLESCSQPPEADQK